MGEIKSAIENKTLKKIILSRPADMTVKRVEGALFYSGNELYLGLETQFFGGKIFQKNIPAEDAEDYIYSLLKTEYRQADVLTTGGYCEIKVSKKGKFFVNNRIGKIDETVKIGAHNREKNYILTEEDAGEFLYHLGVSDKNGRVFDKKRSKFRQINRFLEIFDDVYDKLPESGRLTVYDLCCGKSYLTFAVYYYLTAIKKREALMYGVDIKADVIQYCTDVAERLGYSGMFFVREDVMSFEAPEPPDAVISLHACDIATDFVLAKAVITGAPVILSTPCCQHELADQLNCPELLFVSSHPMLKRKLSETLTDALRVKRLETVGYEVSTLELIDPEETPKNLLIRAIKTGRIIPLSEYEEACKYLGVNPALNRILRGYML